MRRELTCLLVSHFFLVPVTVMGQAAPTELSSENIAGLIADLRSDLDDVRSTIDEMDKAPDGGWFTIWDKESYESDLNSYLDEAFEILVPDVFGDAKRELVELDSTINRVVEEIGELRVALMAAPVGNGKLSLLDRVSGETYPSGSRERISEQIEELESQRSSLQASRRESIEKFANLLGQQFGLDLDVRQVEAALYQVNGGTMVEAAIASRVITQIEAQLSEVIEETGTPTLQRQYYGVAAITRMILVRMHQRHLAKYRDEWYPALDRLELENGATFQESMRTLDRVESEAQRAAIEANLAILDRIGTAINDYRNVLETRENLTLRNLERATIDAEVALNTLKTVETAVQLSFVIESSSRDFAELSQFSTPDFIPLDENSFDEFLEISRMIEGS